MKTTTTEKNESNNMRRNFAAQAHNMYEKRMDPDRVIKEIGARYRAQHGIPRLGAATLLEITTITEKIFARASAAPIGIAADTNRDAVRERAGHRMLDIFCAAISARGGEISIWEKNYERRLEITGHSQGMYLLHARGWRQYSRRYGARRAALSYLCGTDDSGRWMVRVPGTIYLVSQALEWVEPAAVRRARSRGKQVLRQGDVYFCQCAREDDLQHLPRSHRWDPDMRMSTHAQHAPLHVPFFCQIYRQKAYGMGRGRGLGAAD